MTTDRSEKLEIWLDDVASLREESARALPDIDDTAALLSRAARTATHHTTEPKENRLMSIIRHKPIIAIAIAALALLVLAPAAYALVDKFILEIDPDQPEEVIEEDIRDQLEAIGVEPTDVDVEKIETPNGNQVSVEIESEDHDVVANHGLDNMGVRVEGDQGRLSQTRVAFEIPDGYADTAELLTLVKNEAFGSLLSERPTDMTDADYAVALESFFADHGFPNVTANVQGPNVTLSIAQ